MRWWMNIPRSPRSNIRLYSTVRDKHVLRPYQEQCLEACLDALKSGSTRIGVSLPTGSGKTFVFISLLSRISPPSQSPNASRALILVNSVELALQAATQAKKLCPHWTVEIEQGPKHKASGDADVTVATYQTLLQPTRLAKFNAKSLKAVIVDEAHHAAAPAYRRILSHFDSAVKHPDTLFQVPEIPHSIPILGFSATFSRHDGLALGSIFQCIAYHRDFLDMIREQWLCNVRFTSVHADIDLSTVIVNSRTGDFNPTSLAHVVNTEAVNDLIVQTWLDKAAQRKSTLVFCVNLAHVNHLTRSFREAGVDARYVYSGTPAGERKAVIESFKNGQFPVLVNCAILTEGADIPNIDCVILARPTRSRNLFAQMIGRGMRLSPQTGKEDCHVIDFVDSTGRMPGVVCTPSLFGLDPSEIIDDQSIDALLELAESAGDALEGSQNLDSRTKISEPESVTYHDVDNPFALVDQSHGAPHVHKLSRHAWVGCGGDIYVLECLGKGYIRIEKADGAEDAEVQYEAHYTPPSLPMRTAMTLKINPYHRSRKILTASSLDEALRGCDTYAKSKIVQGKFAMGLLRTSRWRKDPATDSQKKFVQKRWNARKTVDESEPDSLQKKIAKLTKGEAANIITRLKHGAQSRYEQKVKANQRAALSLAKEMKRRSREHVRVGPLPQ